MELLSVNNISKRFGGLVAVKNFDLCVNEGEIVGLIGPNGAGKTTAFNLISGTYKADTGSVRFSGEDISNWRPDQICKLGLTRTFQVSKPFREITVLENVMVGAYNRTNDPTAARAKAEEILDLVGLEKYSDKLAKNLPVGGRKQLELARILATDPKMILLDEVMGGLRPSEVNEMIKLVNRLRANGLTVLMIEHVMKAIMSLADRIVVLHHGEKIAENTPSMITQDPVVIEAYLGEAADVEN